MTQLAPISKDFQTVTEYHPSARPPRKRPPPFSIRFTPEEREFLKRQAEGQPLGAYIRGCVLSEHQGRRRPRRQPIHDYEKLAAVLAALGRTHLALNMNQLAEAANSGSLPLSLEVVNQLLQACRDIAEMREALIAALGVKPETNK